MFNSVPFRSFVSNNLVSISGSTRFLSQFSCAQSPFHDKCSFGCPCRSLLTTKCCRLLKLHHSMKTRVLISSLTVAVSLIDTLHVFDTHLDV